MVLVEDAARLRDIDGLLLGQRPGQFDQPIEVGPDHPGLHGAFRHALVAVQLAAGLLLNLRRHGGFRDLLGEFLDLLGAPVALAQLALDRRHLLAQDHLALAFVQGGPGSTADLLRQAQDLDPFGQQAGDLVEPRGEINGFQKLLLLVSADIEIRPQRGPPKSRRGGGLHGPDKLLWHLRQELQRLKCLLPEVKKAGLDVRCQHPRLLDPENPRHDERPLLHELGDPEALLALEDDMVRAVGRIHIAQDVGDGAGSVQINRGRVGHLRVPLHQEADLTLLPHRLLGRGDGALTAELWGTRFPGTGPCCARVR